MKHRLPFSPGPRPSFAVPHRSRRGGARFPPYPRTGFPALLGCAALVGCLLLIGDAFGQNPNSIIFSKHNLSISSPGGVHAATESDICIFCHAPHSASGEGPLWNHELSAAVYKPYSSDTLKATVGQPTGASRLCLGCHDGTVALGMVKNRGSAIPMTAAAMPSGPNNLGTDLSADHPVSFTYDAGLVTANGKLRDPNNLPQEVRLDKSGQVQCTACHDPHNNQYGNFMVMDNAGSALCVSCHLLPEWAASGHAVASAPLPATLQSQLATPNKPTAGVPTVASTACASCHVPHAAGIKQELLRFSTPERNCFSCHGSEGPGLNVAADFNKISGHPISLNGDAHRAQEDLINPATRHVTCVDCHNPHAANNTPGSPTQLSGALAGVAGVNSSGNRLPAVTREYELCYRCHADSSGRGPSPIARQNVDTNKRRQFSASNQSFHPIETLGRNPNVPSLITPWMTTSLMSCTDCHSSDQPVSRNGQTLRAPHGSIYSPLLAKQLILDDYTAESPANYELCYQCHLRESVLSNQSFKGHRQHIVDVKTACTTCHDPHGVATTPRLINFNTRYVHPAAGGKFEFISLGGFSANCTLNCHGKEHVDAHYP